MNWLLHVLGIDTVNSIPGRFWPGFGSDLGEVALIGAVLGAYHRHQCHQGRCWRIARHVVDGTPWCNRHHQAARKEAS